MRAYKLVRVRKDGTLGSLFVDKRRILEKGVWLRADLTQRPKFLAHRPGWHATKRPDMPHLGRKGRRVVQVVLRGNVKTFKRPKAQGGVWYTAEQMLIKKA